MVSGFVNMGADTTKVAKYQGFVRAGEIPQHVVDSMASSEEAVLTKGEGLALETTGPRGMPTVCGPTGALSYLGS